MQLFARFSPDATDTTGAQGAPEAAFSAAASDFFNIVENGVTPPAPSAAPASTTAAPATTNATTVAPAAATSPTTPAAPQPAQAAPAVAGEQAPAADDAGPDLSYLEQFLAPPAPVAAPEPVPGVASLPVGLAAALGVSTEQEAVQIIQRAQAEREQLLAEREQLRRSLKAQNQPVATQAKKLLTDKIGKGLVARKFESQSAGALATALAEVLTDPEASKTLAEVMGVTQQQTIPEDVQAAIHEMRVTRAAQELQSDFETAKPAYVEATKAVLGPANLPQAMVVSAVEQAKNDLHGFVQHVRFELGQPITAAEVLPIYRTQLAKYTREQAIMFHRIKNEIAPGANGPARGLGQSATINPGVASAGSATNATPVVNTANVNVDNRDKLEAEADALLAQLSRHLGE